MGRRFLRPLTLTPAEKSELEHLSKHAPLRVGRRARMILLLAQGKRLAQVAEVLGVHPNTVRNCVTSFYERGVPGLLHAATGAVRPIYFDQPLKEQIVEIAQTPPRRLGLDHKLWSLRLLRRYLIEQGLVEDVSPEGLRQLLRGHDLPAEFWRRPRRLRVRLTPALRRVLRIWAASPHPGRRLVAQVLLEAEKGATDAEIAEALGVGLSHVRGLLRRFRNRGVQVLQTGVTRAALYLERKMRGMFGG